uniref:Uncharacterized protein n=1 Tax=Lynx canadensis TaxID=61383 RepID=A0A667I1E8_LYNCA
MYDMNEYISIEEFAEGCKINARRMTTLERLKILMFPQLQKQMKEEDFFLSHVLTKSQ